MDGAFEEFERRGLQSTLETVVRVRIVLLIVIAVFSVWVGTVDPALWRRVMLAVLVVGLTVLDVETRRRFVKRGFEPRVVRVNLAGMIATQMALLFATGGVSSPLLPVMAPPAFVAGLMTGRRGVLQMVVGVQLPFIALFVILHFTGAVPSLVPEPFRPEGGMPTVVVLLVALAMSILVSVFGILGARVRRTAKTHLGQLAAAQESALASHRQRLDELTTLSGEIAHELKNPLASVKGLSQLLARGRADEAKTAERVAVLEREVGRMEGILDEFLNFSRPLIPLHRAEADLARVCADAVTLHEAMAAERGVHLRLAVDPDLRLLADERKLTQIVVNLIQNAIEVAPQGTEVTLAAARTSSGARVEVRDCGSGLDDSVADRIFEPGVTSKPSGNGLGLTVARAIAEQHGGTLELTNVEGGGCRAVLALPTAQEEPT